MLKKYKYIFLLFLFSCSFVFSQELQTRDLPFNKLLRVTDVNNKNIIYNSNGLSLLSNIERNSMYASTTLSLKNRYTTKESSNMIHHSLVFAKTNFFGINNLEQSNDEPKPLRKEKKSFWDNEIIYFVVGIVAATTLYLVWENSGSENPPQKTFGLPPKP